MRVSLFVTCLNDTLFPQTGIATVRLLERLGHTVEFPEAQTCCGQMHFNSGYRREAGSLARRFAHVFAGADVVVTPSASCAAMVSGSYRELDVEPPPVLELTQFLARERVDDVGASFAGRVAYHPTCHSLRLLRVGTAPIRLLRAVRGLELVELPHADECCGFGGTFAVKNAATSTAMADDKVADVAASGAEVVTALDNSCLMQIGGRLSRLGSPVRPLHLAEILA